MKKRLTALFLAALMAFCLLPVPASAAGTAHFKDVPSTHWAHPYVERAYSDGAIAGTGGDPAKGTGVFSPDSNMTYGQFLTMLMSAFYPDEMARATARTPWYAPAIQVAVDRQLTYISRDDLMNKYADAQINRYNMAWILVKLMEDKGVALPGQGERDAAAAKIGDWKTVQADNQSWPYYVSSVVAAGIISGVDDRGTFNGSGRVSRGAAAVIYAKLSDKVKPGQSSGQPQNPGQPASGRQEFKITFGSGWNMISDPAYRKELEETFYTVYPRLWARWGGGVIQKSLDVSVKPELMMSSGGEAWMWTTYLKYDDAKRVWERAVEVSAKLKDEPAAPPFAHELGHVVQSYKDLKSSWWIESMASYARYRYFYYADEGALAREPSNYIQADDPGLRSWRFENSYYSFWFYAYMDSKYPTTPQGYGLMDSIHYAMRAGKITSDDPNDPNLNAVVKQVTGFSTIEQLRQQYVRELDAGTWTFNGFAGYRDNYITENLPGVPNPTYPKVDGFNLCTGAYTYSVTGEASSRYAANNLLDGNRGTKWQAAPKDITGGNKNHGLCITLSRPMLFDSYTLYHEGSQGDSGQNTVSWKLRYYNEKTEKWVVLDEVTGNTQDVTSRTVKQVQARNLWLEITDPSGSGDGTVRLYELELYNKG